MIVTLLKPAAPGCSSPCTKKTSLRTGEWHTEMRLALLSAARGGPLQCAPNHPRLAGGQGSWAGPQRLWECTMRTMMIATSSTWVVVGVKVAGWPNTDCRVARARSKQ